MPYKYCDLHINSLTYIRGIYFSESRNVDKCLIRWAANISPVGIIQVFLPKLDVQRELSGESKYNISYSSPTELRLTDQGWTQCGCLLSQLALAQGARWNLDPLALDSDPLSWT